jgi:hypothetical protein
VRLREFRLAEVVDEIMPAGDIMAGDWQANAPWRQRRETAESGH